MRKLGTLLAGCLTASLLGGPIASPAMASEEDCSGYIGNFLLELTPEPPPGGPLVELEEGILVIRGDNAIAIATALTDQWSAAFERFRTCFYDTEVACAEAELTQLLAIDPSGYIEIESTGVVKVYYLALFNELIPLAHCYLG